MAYDDVIPLLGDFGRYIERVFKDSQLFNFYFFCDF